VAVVDDERVAGLRAGPFGQKPRPTAVLCYSVPVKNITVSVPEAVYRRARIRAAERNTSVSALVREFLAGFGEEETEFERRKRLQDEVLQSIERFSASGRLTRDEVHDRDALR
jgi:RNA polymerase-interacting CarD/CdnL/TRCF family regulator